MNLTRPLSNLDEFKVICSGINCGRKPTIALKIKYLRKVGQFCERCAADLTKEGLVDELCSSDGDLTSDG